jgi:hypothetical protein
MCFTFTREGFFEVRRDLRVDLLAFRHPDCIRDRGLVVLGEMPDKVKQPAEGSGSLSSTVKAKNVNMLGVTSWLKDLRFILRPMDATDQRQHPHH